MHFKPTSIFNGVALAGVAAILISAGMADRSPGIDPVTTASIGSVDGNITATANRFMVVDHKAAKTCIFALHRAEGYDVHRVDPAENCKGLSERLTAARAWQEMPNGSVTVTDRAGDPILRLGPSDGFAYEVVEPSYLTMSLEAF